jgi:tRNA modification GTPase
MRDFSLSDTIIAIATPPGEGAIAVVRLSGPKAISSVDSIFKGKNSIMKALSGSARYGKVYDADGELIDEVVVTVMRKPNSYTGEDCVEISCHGGYLPSSKIMHTLTQSGIREAERGEFTLRAFLNNRIDLTRAEAVAELVTSRSDLAYETALKQLSGGLFRELQPTIDELKEILSLVELGIDFAEEDIELISEKDIRKRIEEIIVNLENLSNGFHAGRILKEGFRVAITGKINVGKSSLLNTLLGSERAIVTDIPGTTRDTITETIDINGLEVHLTDTAGFRGQQEIIEKEGIERAGEAIASSDLAVVMLDPFSGTDDNDRLVFEAVKDIPSITALNKKDLFDDEKWARIMQDFPMKIDISISALTGENVDELKNMIIKTALGNKSGIGRETVITNRRHYNCINSSVDELRKAIPIEGEDELLAEHLRRALNHLGEIIGEVTTEEILNSIFDNFCIGK